ncbi:hypothetical protein GQR58_004857 [Nymphon striatum]|nr:hypothetical protein GQR58_004857 [Nymphon striatum]
MVYIIPRIFIPYGKSHIRPQIPSSQVSTTTSTSDGKSSRKKEDEEEMDKTRQQPTTKGDKTRKQPGTEIRRLQVIDKTKDDGGKDVTCVTINKLRDLCSAVNQIRQEGLCSAVNQITLTEGDFNVPSLLGI